MGGRFRVVQSVCISLETALVFHLLSLAFNFWRDSEDVHVTIASL